MKLFISLDIDDCIIYTKLRDEIEEKMSTLAQYFSNLESIGQDIVEKNRALIEYITNYVRDFSTENEKIGVEIVSFSNRQTAKGDLEGGFKLNQGGASIHIFRALEKALSENLQNVSVTFNGMLLEDFYRKLNPGDTSKEIEEILNTRRHLDLDKNSFLNYLDGLPDYSFYTSRAYRSKLLLACLLMHCLYGNNKQEIARFLFIDDKYKEATYSKENMLGCLHELFRADPSLIPERCITDFVRYAQGKTPKDIGTVTGTGNFNQYYANLIQLGSKFLEETFGFVDNSVSDGMLLTHFLSQWKLKDPEGRPLGPIFINKCLDIEVKRETSRDTSQDFFKEDRDKDIDVSNPRLSII